MTAVMGDAGPRNDKMTDVNIPLIDLRRWRRGTPAARRALARRVDRACRETGFLIVAGHGVPASAVRGAREAARAFFALAPAEKRRAARPGVTRGWVAVGDEALSYSLGRRTPPDLNESFQIGPLDGRGGPNPWPARPRALKPAWTRYSREMERVAGELQSLFAAALGLPEDWFADKFDRHESRLRARYYPAQAVPPLPGQLDRKSVV